jgi:hypothetical protein
MSRRDKGVIISNSIVELLRKADKTAMTIAVLYICNYWESGALPPEDSCERAKTLFEAWLKSDSKINRFKWKEAKV